MLSKTGRKVGIQNWTVETKLDHLEQRTVTLKQHQDFFQSKMALVVGGYWVISFNNRRIIKLRGADNDHDALPVPQTWLIWMLNTDIFHPMARNCILNLSNDFILWYNYIGSMHFLPAMNQYTIEAHELSTYVR